MIEINIYCDESNHLESDKKPMILGALSCPREKTFAINKRIREIKTENNLPSSYEIKWSKVSGRRLSFYLDLINYFFDIEYLGLRALIADKRNLDHKKYGQDHDVWYYKMYYLLLTKMIRSGHRYKVCLDRKDTQGKQKIDELRKVLCNTEYDFEQKIISEVREVHSNQVQLIQLTDLIIGAIQFNLCSKNLEKENKAKRQIVDHLRKKSNLTLETKTLPSEQKLNLFFWDSKE